MQTVELDMRLPYRIRGSVLGRISKRIRGRIQEIHIYPPNLMGVSEVRMKISGDEISRLFSELKKVAKNGRVDIKVLSDA